MDTQQQQVLIQISKTSMDFTHADAVEIVSTIENFIPAQPIRSVGGYGNFNFPGVATGDIQLQDGMRIYENEDIDLTDPRNFARLVEEELTIRKSGLVLTGKSREDRDDQFYFENVGIRTADAIRKGESHVYLASIGSWEMIFKCYGKKASLIERLMTRWFEKSRVQFIAKYALPDWQKFLVRYFKAAGENPTPKYYKETFTASPGDKEITVIGYSLVLQL